MEFLFEDTVPPPQEPELRAYFQAHMNSAPSLSASVGAAQRRPVHGRFSRLSSPPPYRGAEDDGDPLPLGEGLTITPLTGVGAMFLTLCSPMSSNG
jgi:hypothetical protein